MARSSKHISLGLVFHNHQPVGNDEAVIERIFHETYEPQVGALERHPGVAAGLHYTGSLLDWLVKYKPEFLERVRKLVERGQVEVLSGGYYEPILPLIPDDDKLEQIQKMTGVVKHLFGYNATGMWLAERVWEPTLPSCLAGAGIEWTLLDDVHFKIAGLSDEDLSGYYMTEDDGKVVGVYGISKALRYAFPWKPVDETMQYLKSEAVTTPGKIIVVGDQGEKLGAWPGTYELCWGEGGDNGWVDEFFSAIEANRSWLYTVKLGDHMRNVPAAGRVYLPTASYTEMMEWALPAARGAEFSRLLSKVEKTEPEAAAYMRGGFWRNFLVKYPEANDQHKKTLRVHDKIQEARNRAGERADAHARLDEAQEDLWRGQSNDTYWHGRSGGVYMNDVRVRVQAHLCRAQQAAERVMYGDANWVKPEITDFDRDSMQELLIEGNALNLYVDMADGGSIFWWDLRKHNYNLASILSRRPESYHEALREFEERKRSGKRRKKADPLNQEERLLVKEENLDRLLNYDWYRRNSMIDHFLGPGTTLENFAAATYNEEGDFVNGAYKAEIETVGSNTLHIVLERDGSIKTPKGNQSVRVSKRLTLKPGSPNMRVLYTIQNTGDTELTGLFGSEWNINLLGGGHNPNGYYRVEGVELEDDALDSTGEVRNVKTLALGNSWLGIEMEMTSNIEGTFWRFPIETVSGSQAGFERVYQGSCVLFQWLFRLVPDDSLDIELEWKYKGNG